MIVVSKYCVGERVHQPDKTGKQPVIGASYMAVTANPLATQAGCEVLRDGGTAVDAAVAVQMVLGLVEPQSSGVGGGAFMLHYKASNKTVQSYDGRETAPAAATEDYLRYVSATDKTNPLPNLGTSFLSTKASGRSIGTPGAVRMLALAHADHGKLAWADLFQPGIDLATNGFKISGRMAKAIAGARTNFARDAEASAAYLKADGTPRLLGETFSMADVIFGGTVRYMLRFKMLESRPAFEDYVSRLNTRPASIAAEAKNAAVAKEHNLGG